MSQSTRYSRVLSDIYAIVKKLTIENIIISPMGHVGTQSPKEYIRFNPVLSEKAVLNNLKGILYFDIYTTMGEGPTRAYVIADIIETYFLGQSFDSGDNSSMTQFSRESNLVVRGEAKNPIFLLTTYQIHFNNFRKEI